MFSHCNKPVRFAALALLWAVISVTPAISGQSYLQEVTDMPLPAGFTEDTAASVAFDKPEGRIVEAAASGPADRADVVGYYRSTLPELGWTPVAPAGALTWRRDGETLRLEVAESGPQIVIRFHIAPQ